MTQIVPAKERIQTVRDLLEKSKTQIAIALPRQMNADRMLRVAMTTLQRTPKLLECTPVSFVGAVMQSAQLGLECDGVLGHAYIIPYYNKKTRVFEASFQPGYKGLLALARRSGDLGPVDARVVHARDFFEYEFGLEPKLRHKPSADEDRGDVTFAYAIVKLKDGTAQYDVMTAWEIEAHRQQYSRATSDDTPWQTSWDSMACKTVLKRVLKLAPASIEVQRAIALDEHVEAGLPQDLGALATVELALDPSPAAADKTPNTLDGLTAKLKPAVESVESAEPPSWDKIQELLEMKKQLEEKGVDTKSLTWGQVEEQAKVVASFAVSIPPVTESDAPPTYEQIRDAPPETHFDDGPPMEFPPPVPPAPATPPAEQTRDTLIAEITALRARLKMLPERFYGLARTHCATTLFDAPNVTTSQLIKLRHALLLLEKRETT